MSFVFSYLIMDSKICMVCNVMLKVTIALADGKCPLCSVGLSQDQQVLWEKNVLVQRTKDGVRNFNCSFKGCHAASKVFALPPKDTEGLWVCLLHYAQHNHSTEFAKSKTPLSISKSVDFISRIEEVLGTLQTG